MRKLAAVISSFIIAASLIALSGCGGGSKSSTTTDVPAGDPAHTVVLLGTGYHANTPQLQALPDGLNKVLAQCIEEDTLFDVVLLDGKPEVVGASRLASTAGTDQKRTLDNQRTLQALNDLLLNSAANDPGSNLLLGLELACRSLSAMDDDGLGKRLIVVDSLIGDEGELGYKDGGVSLQAAPDDVVAYAMKNSSLSFDGVAVEVYFAGDVDGETQKRLSASDLLNLKTTFSALMEQAGAVSVTFHADTPVVNKSDAKSLPAVIPAAVSTPGAFDADDCILTLDSANQVGFMPGSAEFLDPEGAEATLRNAAEVIIRSGKKLSIVAGTANDGTREYQANLAQDRANTVRDRLVSYGVNESCIVCCEGLPSTDTPWYTDDRIGDVLDPVIAESNRRCVCELVD